MVVSSCCHANIRDPLGIDFYGVPLYAIYYLILMNAKESFNRISEYHDRCVGGGWVNRGHLTVKNTISKLMIVRVFQGFWCLLWRNFSYICPSPPVKKNLPTSNYLLEKIPIRKTNNGLLWYYTKRLNTRHSKSGFIWKLVNMSSLDYNVWCSFCSFSSSRLC